MPYHICFDKSLIAKELFYCEELEVTLAGFAVLVANNTLYSDDSLTDFPVLIDEEDLPECVIGSYNNELDQIMLKERKGLYQQSFQIVGHYAYQFMDKEQADDVESLSLKPVEVTKVQFDTFLKKYHSYFESEDSLQSISVFREYVSVESDESKTIYVLAGREGFYPAVPLETQETIFKEIKQFLPNFPCYTLDTSVVKQDERIYLVASLTTSGEEVFLYFDLETNNIISLNSSPYEFWCYFDAKLEKKFSMAKQKRKKLEPDLDLMGF